jgi:hypothetical protein
VIVDDTTECECGHIADEHEVNDAGAWADCTVCSTPESADVGDPICGGFDPAGAA